MVWVLSLAVGIVLADSAIVTLALPDVLRDYDAQVGQVAWVLTAYNLVLGLAAVPAARGSLSPEGARRSALIGVVGVFAAASAICGVAPSLPVLIVARAVQAIGGALVITASLELLVAATGSARIGAARWATAGVIGAGVGPVAGGLLTEAFSWRAIFLVQVPLVLLALPAVRDAARRAVDPRWTSEAETALHPFPWSVRTVRGSRRTSRSGCSRRRSPPRSSCSSCCSSRAGVARPSPPHSRSP